MRIDALKKRVKDLLRPVYWLILDTLDLMSGKRDGLTPPRRLIFIGDGDFRKTGDEFFRYFVELGGLKPDSHVLDVGCGIGRMAVPLTRFLTSGSYEGFDIVPKGIKWCNRTITKKHPNFSFRLANIYNKTYNPKGDIAASEYRFPFADESFDLVFLTSVFTHMLPADVENYLSEIHRVLKKDGRGLVTHFLISEESLSLVKKGVSRLEFRDSGKGYWTTSESTPEEAVAYDESELTDLYKKRGLTIVNPVHYGSWCGREKYLSFQDIFIIEKESDLPA